MVKKKHLNKYLALLFAFFLLVVGFIAINIPYEKLKNFYLDTSLTKNELSNIENTNYFGPFIKVKLKGKKTVNFNSNKSSNLDFIPEIEFRLFDLIPIKTQKVRLFKEDSLLVSGSAVGLVLKTDGVLIVGSSPVSTENGERDVLEENCLQVGDIIKQIENETIDDVASISRIINEEKNKNKELNIQLVRHGKEVNQTLRPYYDIKRGNYKLGVWVRDDASGIGTLTYIDSSNRFGALGHPICDSDTKSKINLKEGSVYNCSILGVEKGISGNPGEIKGLFMQGKASQGTIEKNNDYGVYGTLKRNTTLFDSCKKYEIGGKLSVKPGKAQIRCCIDGTSVETFDIEIIKTNYQSYSNEKSMVIRIIDANLISRTGGIVQGMSGSPILQNGKIVGAVTHVFVSDPTKGFGVYIDWMLNQ